MMAAAIIPAKNEARTIGAVVRTLIASGFFSEVIVVSDGSVDGTVFAATFAGATKVIELPVCLGKGAALHRGVEETSAEALAFFDADLVGLTADHVREVMAPVMGGGFEMFVGIQDYGLLSSVAPHFPKVSGQRALRRDVFEGVPAHLLHGYKVESALNELCRTRGYRVGAIVLSGLSAVRKIDKVGILRGAVEYAKMWTQVAGAFVEARTKR